jgi:hypothetical protein
LSQGRITQTQTIPCDHCDHCATPGYVACHGGRPSLGSTNLEFSKKV